MSTIEIILGILIAANVAMSILTQNWSASCGWLVAGLEWFRRL